MGRTTKYKGGTKIVTIRVPVIGYKATRARLNALLNTIAEEMKEKDKTTLSPTLASAKTTLANKPKTKEIDYACGCSYDGTLFRRGNNCKIAKVNHKAVG